MAPVALRLRDGRPQRSRYTLQRLPDRITAPLFVEAWFFSTLGWNRTMVRDWLTPSPALARSWPTALAQLLGNTRHETVSLHLRMGYAGETASDRLAQRAMPPESFYQAVFETIFPQTNARRFVFIVLADNSTRAEAQMESWDRLYGPLDYRVVDANVVVSLGLMAACQHHVLTASTLSFWGAYLSPHDGTTVVPASFLVSHGPSVITQDLGWRIL